MNGKRAFTLIELLVVIAIIAMLIGILMPSLGAARRNAQRMESNARLRGIHQGCVQYADGNRYAFPGLGSDNLSVPIAASARYQLLINGNAFSSDYMISPLESKTVWTTGPVTTTNFSYTMLQLGTVAQQSVERNNEWGTSTGNAEAIMLSDRSIVIDASLTTASIHTMSTDPLKWQGGVVWNDNHVSFNTQPDGFRTNYRGGNTDDNDNLFANPNALMTFD